MVARTVTDVILGEAAGGRNRYQDMLAVASAIANRSNRLGVTPQNVVSRRSEFNAYGKALPPGVNAFRSLADKAWNQVQTQGPVHTGTFYATPAAVGNLPKGLREVHTTSGHRYFDDPQNRSINTALGYRQPTALTGAQQAIAAQTSMARQPTNVPTPTFATRTAPTLSASLATNPINPSAVRSASAVPSGLTAMATRGGRIGPSTAYGVPTPTARPSMTAPTQIATRAPDVSRFGSYTQTETMPKAMQDRFAAQAGVTGSRVAPQTVTAGLAPSPQQEANLRDRLGTFAPPTDIASLRTRSVPTPTANPLSVGSLLGVSAARAAPVPTSRPSAPVSGVAGAIGSLRSRASQLPAGALDTIQAAQVASRVPTPTSAPRTAVPAAAPSQRVATPSARPQTAPQRVAAAPARQAQAVARDPWGGLRQPAAVAATPQVARTSAPLGLTPGRIAGAAIGSVIGGPLGGLLGGAIGGRIGNASAANAAQGRGGPAGSNAGRSSPGRSSGGSAFAGGNGGFSERDSAVGRDGGKVGGSGRSSSGGRSGSSSGGGKSGGSGKGGKK